LIPGVKGRQWTIQRVGVATFIRVGQPGLIVSVLDKLFDPQVEASQTRGAQCAVNNNARRREALYAPFVASFVARTVAFGIIPESDAQEIGGRFANLVVMRFGLVKKVHQI